MTLRGCPSLGTRSPVQASVPGELSAAVPQRRVLMRPTLAWDQWQRPGCRRHHRVTCVPLLVETFGGLSPALMHELRAAAEWRSNKLTSSEYDETTWSARTWLTFVAQRLSVAVQLSVAQEAAEALGLSVAADPRAR